MADDVVVATADLDDEVVRHLAAACDRLAARYVAWDGGELRLERPSLMVAGLPAGQRRVPPHLMRLCTDQHPGTPLLLLCHEGLVSPTVSLHGGQIVLVGPPFSSARLYGRLAVLAAERAGREPDSVVSVIDDPHQPVWTRERLHADVWVASVGCRGLGGGVPLAPIVSNGPDGVTALLPCRPDAVVDEPTRIELTERLAAAGADLSLMTELRDRAPGLAMIHYDRRSEEWRVIAPAVEHLLWLHSAHRLPALWNLSAGMARRGGRVVRAAAGDLMVGLTGLPDGDADELAAQGYDQVMRRGGHSLLAALERRLHAVPRALAGVLVELRP